MIAKVANGAVNVVRVGIIQKILRNRKRSVGQRLHKYPIDLGRHLIGTLVGNLRRNGVLLLVRVIDDLRMLNVIGVERHHVAAEAFGDDHGSVILTRTCTVDSIFLGCDHPVDLVVRS